MAEVQAQFQDLRTLERITLTLNPDMVQDAKGLSGPVTPIPGKGNPQVSAGAGGVRTINLQLRIARLIPDLPDSYVKDTVSWFYSVLNPYIDSKYDQHKWTPVQFKWGDLYDIPVRVRRVESKFPLFQYATALPEYADTILALEEVSVENISTPEIRTDGQGFVRFLVQ